MPPRERDDDARRVRLAGWAIAIVVVALCVTSLGSGLALDDELHRLFVAQHRAGLRGDAPAWDLFRVSAGDAEAVAAAIESGLMPWWTDPHHRLGFFRPLAGWSHYLDYWLWPDATWAMHFQNLGWYLVVILLWLRVARERLTLDPWIAVLAATLFAVDEAHAPMVGWVAQRNALMAATFGLAGLWAHLRWREDRWPLGLSLSLGGLALALASSEVALAVWAYVLAHALICEDGWRGKLTALAPSTLLLAGYATIYRELGYGAAGAGPYVDPGHDPLAFLTALGERWPALWSATVAPVTANTGVTGATLAAGALATLAILTVTWDRLATDRRLRAMVLGSVLALIPACAAPPADRMLLVPGLGVSLWLAHALRSAWPPGRGPGRLAQLVAAAIVVAHLILPAVRFPGRAGTIHQGLDRQQRELAAITQAALAAGTGDLFIANAPAYHAGLYLGQRPEDRVRFLGATTKAVMVAYPTPHELILQPVDGFFRDPVSTLLRGPNRPYQVGERVELPGVRVEIRRLTDDGFPREVLYTFDAPLDRLRLVAWDGRGFAPVDLPAPGKWTVLPAPGHNHSR